MLLAHWSLEVREPPFGHHSLVYFIASEADKCCCQSVCRDAPPFQLGAHRGFASGFYASLGPRLQDCPPPPPPPAAARTLGCGLFTAETCRPLPPLQLLQFVQKSGLASLSMAVRGVICTQQRNS